MRMWECEGVRVWGYECGDVRVWGYGDIRVGM